jgi:hypothetical protein
MPNAKGRVPSNAAFQIEVYPDYSVCKNRTSCSRFGLTA